MDPQDKTDSRPKSIRESEYPDTLQREKSSYVAGDEDTSVDLAGSSPTQNVTAHQEGEQIGNYQLVEIIGQGGMGTVWKAQQTQPIERELAIKLVQSDRHSKQLASRLESERKALALMDHPGIARMIDAGTTEKGQPYFAMELFEGRSLVRYCDQHQLNIIERLILFVDICNAVQHAHQKGVIHRDLKPGNILARKTNDHHEAKIIDFGLAKATDELMSFGKDKTAYGQLLGTLQYMSPEQARLDQAKVDTRTDVYSLGAVLYELLCGETPLGGMVDDDTPVNVTVDTVINKESQPPSRRLASLTMDDDRFNDRKISLAALQTMLAGDLDWVVMKAIDKEPNQRYQSSSELAADVERFLNGEPVVARPPSMVYRTRKFIRKHRWSVAASLALAFALVAGIVGTSIGWTRAVAAENLAEVRFKESERARKAEQRAKLAEATRAESEKEAKEMAEDLLEQTESYNDILRSMIRDLNVRIKEKTTVPLERRLADQLIAAGEQIAKQDYDGPKLQLQTLNEIGTTLISLGYPNEAVVLFKRVDEIIANDPSELKQSWVAWAECNLAKSLIAASKPEHARTVAESSVKLYEQLGGKTNKNTIAAMHTLATSELLSGEIQSAIEHLEFVVPERIKLYGPNGKATLISMSVLATAYERNNELVMASEMMKDLYDARRETLGPKAVGTLTTLSNMASLEFKLGNEEKALELQTQAFDGFNETLSEEHPSSLAVASKLAEFKGRIGSLDEAKQMLNRVIPQLDSKLGSTHARTLIARSNLAAIQKEQEGPAEALPVYRKLYSLASSEYGVANPETRAIGIDFSRCLIDAGKSDEAETILLDLKAESSKRLSPSHPVNLSIDELLNQLAE